MLPIVCTMQEEAELFKKKQSTYSLGQHRTISWLWLLPATLIAFVYITFNFTSVSVLTIQNRMSTVLYHCQVNVIYIYIWQKHLQQTYRRWHDSTDVSLLWNKLGKTSEMYDSRCNIVEKCKSCVTYINIIKNDFFLYWKWYSFVRQLSPLYTNNEHSILLFMHSFMKSPQTSYVNECTKEKHYAVCKYICDLYTQCISSHFTDDNQSIRLKCIYSTGLILGLHPTNERCRYKVTPSFIGLGQLWKYIHTEFFTWPRFSSRW